MSPIVENVSTVHIWFGPMQKKVQFCVDPTLETGVKGQELVGW